MTLRILPIAVLSACWHTDAIPLPGDSAPFAPAAGEVEGWTVSAIDVGLTCPDGGAARSWVVHPDGVLATDVLPVAVVFHSGSFDYVLTPTTEDPVSGEHFADPDRLSSEWASRQIFATLGMYPSSDPREVHDGTLAVALAEAGVALLLPANCWGDWWHNEEDVVANDVEELFARNGRASARTAIRLALEPEFAALNQIPFPFTVDPTGAAMYGLGGEGSRAVGEVLAIDANADGIPDHMPNAAVVDSPIDDLGVYYDNAAVYPEIVTGLDRIFLNGAADTATGSVAAASALPERFAYVYSSIDSLIPVGANDLLVARLDGDDLSLDSTLQAHVQLNGDLALAKQVVAYAHAAE